jgi:hypothetical protein
MPRFQIYPADRSFSAQLVTPDAADVLNAVHHLNLREAEVDCDGLYSFSISLSNNGLWCIFQRDQADTPTQ